jgi:hypothetical protein
LAFGKCCCKKNGFFQFFPILCFDLKLKHFSDSAGLLSAKGKSCPRPKAEKKFFSKKNLEKRFHDNKKSLSDEKTRFLRTK